MKVSDYDLEGPICGSDGDQYQSLCELIMNSCKTKRKIEPRPKTDCKFLVLPLEFLETSQSPPSNKIMRNQKLCTNYPDYLKCSFGAICKLYGEEEKATAYCDCSPFDICTDEIKYFSN